jgi:hypothetical protein
MNKGKIMRDSMAGHFEIDPIFRQPEFSQIYIDRIEKGIRIHEGGL